MVEFNFNKVAGFQLQDLHHVYFRRFFPNFSEHLWTAASNFWTTSTEYPPETVYKETDMNCCHTEAATRGVLERCSRALIKFLRFLAARLWDAGAYLIFRELWNIIIFCKQVYEVNKSLSY